MSLFTRHTQRGREHVGAAAGWETFDDDDRSIGDIARDLTEHAQLLVRGEIDLVRNEIENTARQLAIYVVLAVVGAVLALAALGMLSIAVAEALNQYMPAWGAYGIVGLVWVTCSVGLVLAALAGFRDMDAAPTDSIDTAREDVQWVKAHT
jgi:hypothetical protein